MTDRVTVRLDSELARQRACDYIWKAPNGHSARIGEETRSDAQNRMMWPLIKDIREQVPGMGDFNPDDTKLRFLHALGQEMRFLPELDGNGMFPVGQRSSTLSKTQFTLLIELLLKFGDEHDVRWSHRSLQVRDEAREAA